jgi:hypothetical protein
MKTFYTLPEAFYSYPFLLAPFPNHHKKLMKAKFKHAIVDCGVEIFAQGKQEYPHAFHMRYQFVANQYTQIFGEKIWFVIPDYPDDYRNNPIENNIHKTLVNIKQYHEVSGVNWVYPIQTDYLNLQSFHDSCHQVMKFNPERVAIGTVCKCNDLEFIEQCCRMVRQHFYLSHIHAFGVTLRALPKLLPFIDSWDSNAWTFPRKPGHSCKNMAERKEYYYAYLKRIDEILHDYNSQARLLEVVE